jgi:hypothetical protein
MQCANFISIAKGLLSYLFCQEKETASKKALIGQPVLIDAQGAGVLRVCLSAPMVTDMAATNSAATVLRHDRYIIDKIELIVKNYRTLTASTGL